MDVGRLGFDVEHEPEFEARVRKCRAYPAIPSLVEGLLNMGMFVTVEHTPNLVNTVVGMCSAVFSGVSSSLLD